MCNMLILSLHCVSQIGTVRKEVDKIHLSNTFNMKTVKEKLRSLKNGVESCRTIPEEFISECCVYVCLCEIAKICYGFFVVD